MNDDWNQGKAGIGYTGGDLWEWQKGKSVYDYEQSLKPKPSAPAAPVFTPTAPTPISWVPAAQPATASYPSVPVASHSVPSPSATATSNPHPQAASPSYEYSHYEPGLGERIADWFRGLLASALEIILLPFRWAWALIKVALWLVVCLLVVGALVKAFSNSSTPTPSPIEQRPFNTPQRVSTPHLVPTGQRYLQLASERSESDANARAALEAKRQLAAPAVCVFESPTGFGIALGPLPKEDAIAQLASLRKQGTIPNDSILAATHHLMRTCYRTATSTL